MIRLEMKNHNMILTEKREAAKISVLSSGKIDKYEYLADEEKITIKSKANNRTI